MILKPNSFGTNIRIQHLKNAIGDTRFNTALELGCGDGYLLANVNAENKVGYDLKPRHTLDDIIYQKTDFDGSFSLPRSDIIVCSEVLEHIEHDLRFMRKMYESLVSGGVLFLSTINSNIRTDKSEIDKERGHHRRYNIGDLTTMLEQTGFGTYDAYPMRSNHYYDAKNGLVEYSISKDREQGVENASGLVYVGVK